LVPRRPRSGLTRRAFGSTASLHKAGPEGSPPRAAHPPGSPGRRSKVTGSKPRAPAPPRARPGARSGPCPIAAPRHAQDRAAARTSPRHLTDA
jgi:hypothetical protein